MAAGGGGKRVRKGGGERIDAMEEVGLGERNSGGGGKRVRKERKGKYGK